MQLSVREVLGRLPRYVQLESCTPGQSYAHALSVPVIVV
jgi:hypothetical protein